MGTPSVRIRLSGIAAALVVCVAAPVSAQVTGMTVRRDVHHDVSPPLSVMMQLAPPAKLERREAEPVRRIPLPPGMEELSEDPVRQNSNVLPASPVVTQSFEGLGAGQYGFSVSSAPPDTNGTVGATQYVQWVNSSFAIFNKTTGALISGPTAGNTLWSGFGGGCQTNNDGDPVVLYDKAAQRWVTCCNPRRGRRSGPWQFRRPRSYRPAQHPGNRDQHRQRLRFSNRQLVPLGRLQRHAG
ncbi:MAG: hypothetical protein H0X25_01360 [Acidobacteriales bacterium]|nr:hypothetical protein [Terriglobales bacterium]